MKGLFLFTALISLALSASAQQVTLKKEDIPRIPTDTLPTDRGEVRIVVFSDGTFRYIPTNPWHFRSAPAYGSHWDTLNLFAYRTVRLDDLPARTGIELSGIHGFHVPVQGKVLSKYGPRGRRDHNGVDVRVDHGQPIFAAFDGIVRHSRWNSGGFGNIIIIRHPSGLETYYAHLSRRTVVADEWVRAGQVIGYGGRTGRATTNHLHFEIRYADQSFDPERLIDFERGKLLHRTYSLHKEYFNIRSRAVEGIEQDPLLASVSGVDSLSTTAPGADSLLAETAIPPADGTTTAAPEVSAKPDPPARVYHDIVSGDTLLALALHYGTSVASICDLNGIARTTTLRLGRRLRIK